MKLKHPFFTKLGGLLSVSAVKAWMGTLDYRIAYYDQTVDPALDTHSGWKIYLLWHENILFPIYLRGHCNVAMLMSRHGDADLLAETVKHLGFDYVRGSTFDGGSTSLRELLRKARSANLGMTPDGPRGPRRVLSQGPIYLASKLRMPIVAMGFGYDCPWRTNTRDRFAIPRPGSRARAVWSPAVNIPRNLDRDGLEHYRVEIERLLNRMTCEAEAWAESGTSKIGERPFLRESAQHLLKRRLDAAHAARRPKLPFTAAADTLRMENARVEDVAIRR